MVNSNVFDYVNVLQKAADAAWLRNDVLAHNVSNIDTPGYKRQDVDFEGQLRKAMKSIRYKSVDERVSAISRTQLKPRIYTDSANFSYRLDGNNVDMDTEGAYVAANQIKYNGLVDSWNNEFDNLKMVMK